MNDKPGADEARPAPPARRATALARATGEELQVLAQAAGRNADLVVEVARVHDIPVLQDLALSSALGRLPPGSRIPEDVFLALACTLDFLFQQEAREAAAAEPDSSGA